MSHISESVRRSSLILNERIREFCQFQEEIDRTYSNQMISYHYLYEDHSEENQQYRYRSMGEWFAKAANFLKELGIKLFEFVKGVIMGVLKVIGGFIQSFAKMGDEVSKKVPKIESKLNLEADIPKVYGEFRKNPTADNLEEIRKELTANQHNSNFVFYIKRNTAIELLKSYANITKYVKNDTKLIKNEIDKAIIECKSAIQIAKSKKQKDVIAQKKKEIVEKQTEIRTRNKAVILIASTVKNMAFAIFNSWFRTKGDKNERHQRDESKVQKSIERNNSKNKKEK